MFSVLKKNKKKINLLDFGSNLLTYANFKNKIFLKNYNISIFDPFCRNNLTINNINIFSNERKLKKKWDIINFGSSIQYLNSLNELNKINFNKNKLSLITHAPISSKFIYRAKQLNSKNFYQNIYSFKEICIFFIKKKYKTFSANLLF